MHGDEPEFIAEKIADMRGTARESRVKLPMTYGMAAYAIVRDTTEEEASRPRWRASPSSTRKAPGFSNFDQWISGTELERELKIQEYSVSNRGLRPGLIGTPDAGEAHGWPNTKRWGWTSCCCR